MLRRPLNYLFPSLFRRTTKDRSERSRYPPLELSNASHLRRLRVTQSQEEILCNVQADEIASEGRGPLHLCDYGYQAKHC